MAYHWGLSIWRSPSSRFFLFNHQMPVGKKAMAAKRLDQNPQCDTSSWTPAPFWVPSPDRTKWLQAETVPSGFQDFGGLVGGVKGTVTRTKVMFNPKDIIWVSLKIGEPQNEWFPPGFPPKKHPKKKRGPPRSKEAAALVEKPLRSSAAEYPARRSSGRE